MWFVNKAGIGDEIDLTAVVREYRRTYPDEKIQVDTPRKDVIFLYNPHLQGGHKDGRPTLHLNQIHRPHEAIGNIAVSYAIQAGIPMWDCTPEMFFKPIELLSVWDQWLAKPVVDAGVHRPKVAIDVWAKWPSRRWAHDRFKTLARRLIDDGCIVVEMGKTDYDDRGDCLRDRIPSTLCLFDKLGLRQSAAVMTHMDLYVGNDSGLMHMAAACGVPQVAVFGPKPWYSRGFPNTYPVFAPMRCPHVCDNVCTQINHPCMSPITVDHVHHAVRQALTLYKKQPAKVAQ